MNLVQFTGYEYSPPPLYYELLVLPHGNFVKVNVFLPVYFEQVDILTFTNQV